MSAIIRTRELPIHPIEVRAAGPNGYGVQGSDDRQQYVHVGMSRGILENSGVLVGIQSRQPRRDNANAL